MSDMIAVDIKTPQNEILEGSQLPLDYSVQMIIDELIDTLELPRHDESMRPLGYILRSAQLGRALTNNESVFSAQIRNGDMLEILPLGATSANYSQEQPAPPNPITNESGYVTGGNNNFVPPPTVAMPNTSEINVVLSVMDLNRHETVSLSINRPVGDLIRQIVGNYNLPARDNLNQPIKYKLQSKAMGRFLDERMTLLEAQIPPLDRLTLHREEIAG